jgi:hypothetical protein
MDRRQLLQQMLLGKVAICLQKTERDLCLSPCTHINSKWFKDLKRAGYTLEAIGIGKDFLSRIQAAQQLKERIDKWDYRKLKSFRTTKEMVSKLKRSPTG